jgi:hypothetical protein
MVFQNLPFTSIYLYLHGFVQDAPLDSEAHKKAGLGTPGNRGLRRKYAKKVVALGPGAGPGRSDMPTVPSRALSCLSLSLLDRARQNIGR